MVYSFLYLCRSDGMADVTDSKSVGSDTVWVRVPPSAPRRSKVRFAPASFFCLRQKKTPSARSLAPPFQLRPALLARSWQAALRAAFFSNRRSQEFPRSFQARGTVRFAPPFQLRPALLARNWQAALRAAFSSNRRSRGFPFLPGRGAVRFAPASFFCLRQKRRHPHAPLLLLSNCDPLCWLAVGRPPCGRHSSPIGGLGGPRSFQAGGTVRFAPIFFVPGKKHHPHARPAILRCGFSIPYSLRSLKTRQALRPFPFSLDVLRAWFVSNLQKKCPVLHFGTFLFLPSCYILCIERNIPQ